MTDRRRTPPLRRWTDDRRQPRRSWTGSPTGIDHLPAGDPGRAVAATRRARPDLAWNDQRLLLRRPAQRPARGGIVAPIAALMQAGYAAGVRRFVLTQDTHDPDAPEFAAMGRRTACAAPRGRDGGRLYGAARSPMSSASWRRTASAARIGTGFDAWLDAPEQREVDTFVVVGDCTDLCTYQLAMHLKLRANAAGPPGARRPARRLRADLRYAGGRWPSNWASCRTTATCCTCRLPLPHGAQRRAKWCSHVAATV